MSMSNGTAMAPSRSTRRVREPLRKRINSTRLGTQELTAARVSPASRRAMPTGGRRSKPSPRSFSVGSTRFRPPPAGLLTRTRGHAELRRRRLDFPVPHHPVAVAEDLGDVQEGIEALKRVALHDQHIGQLAHLQGAELVVHAEDPGVVPSGGEERFGGVKPHSRYTSSSWM